MISESLAWGALRRAGLSTQTSASGGVASWGTVLVTTSGGQYRLCWCSGSASCGGAAAFRVDMGSLSVAGPGPLPPARTCVSGQPCAMEDLTGLLLTAGDGLLVLDTCGEGVRPPRWPRRAAAVVVASGGTSMRAVWGAATASGGWYRLCWCGAGTPSGCSVAEDHAVDAGALLLIGPSPLRQDRTCVSGRGCVLAGLRGEGLRAGDAVMAAETCGSSDSLPLLSGLGSLISVTASGAQAAWRCVLCRGGAREGSTSRGAGAASMHKAMPPRATKRPHLLVRWPPDQQSSPCILHHVSQAPFWISPAIQLMRAVQHE